MKNLAAVVLALAVCAGAVFLAARPAHVEAQLPGQIELACPPGSMPAPVLGATFNGSTQKIRQVLCLDSNGNYTGNLPVTIFSAGSGASASTFLRGDGAWATVPGGDIHLGSVNPTSTALNVCTAETSTNDCLETLFTSSHTIVRFVFRLTTTPQGCTGQPVVGIRDQTAGSNLVTSTIANFQATGFVDSGAISVTTTAGNKLVMGLLVASTGCTQAAIVQDMEAVLR